MTPKIDPNAPAYPSGFAETDREYERPAHEPGLTILAEMAKAAMQGILSNPNWEPTVIADEHQVAHSALRYADALITALNTTPRRR